MAEPYSCIVAIPTRELFAGVIYYANVPSVEGSYGVLPGHELLVALNKKGGVLTLNLDEAGQTQKKFLLYEGASQVQNDVLTVLGRFGVDVDNIDVAEVTEKAERMREHIASLDESAESVQEKVALKTSKERLEWYEIQIAYKAQVA